MKSAEFEEKLRQCQEMPGANDPVYRSSANEMIREAGGSITYSRKKNRDVFERLVAAGEDDAKRRWQDLGASPMDARFAKFAELYVVANSEQRQILRNSFDGERLGHLAHFVARAGRLLEMTGDPRWLRIGLAGACIHDGRWDFRDLIVSLNMLRYGAERAGIAFKPYIKEAVEMTSDSSGSGEAPPVSDLLLDVALQPKRTLRHYVRNYGPPEWKGEIKPWWKFW